jgi:Ca2+-binding RTX toxin-like protein
MVVLKARSAKPLKQERAMTTTPIIWKSFTANLNALPGSQHSPSVTALANGDLLVAWSDDTAGTSPGFDVFAQVFSAEGAAKGQAFQLNTVSSGNGEFGGKVAALPDGGFVVVYAIATSAPVFEGVDLVVERRDASGHVVFSQTLHDTYTTGSTYDIAVAANGDYTVQFMQYFDSSLATDTDVDAFGFIYDFDTNARGTRFSTGRNASDYDDLGGAAALAGGGFAYVSIKFDGTTPFVVATAVNGAGQTILQPFTSGEGFSPGVAGLTDGNFAITYTRGGDVFYRVISPEGGASPELVAAGGAGSQVRPAITQLADGGFFIAWNDFDGGSIAGQRFDASGTAIGAPVNAATGLGFQTFHDIDLSLATDGRILIAYEDAFANIGVAIYDPRGDAVSGTSGDDTLTARTIATRVDGFSGNDTLLGQGGSDILSGDDGDDIIQGGGGVDIIEGGEGNDRVVLLEGHVSDNVSGGDGRDTLDLSAVSGRAASVDFAAGSWFMTPGFLSDLTIPPVKGQPLPPIPVVPRRIDGIERVLGTQKDDQITGADGNDAFFGNGGDDTLDGGAGNDRLNGGDGLDNLTGGAGADRLIGGLGLDVANYTDSTTSVSVALDGSFAGTGDALGDTFSGVENIRGSNAAAGDSLRGNAGGNTLFGLAGADVLDGRAGADRLVGGRGADRLTGGDGDDQFFYNALAESGDTVADFTSNAAGGDDSFRFRGTAFGGLADGQILASQFEANATGTATLATTRFVYDTNDEALFFDANGSAAGGTTLIATLQNGAVVTFADITIF